ncbi:MAG: response regulator, partial [Desulfobacteraceae bacterium]|nr:response regulator [Desulfobacteraceae bacterium]
PTELLGHEPDRAARNMILCSTEEREYLKKDGIKIPVLFSNSHIFDEYGKISGIVMLAQDISKLKTIQAQKTDLEEKLARGKKMEALGLLAGGVAHDLNNILSGIITYPEIMLMDLDKKDPMRKSINIIQKSGQRAVAVVQDLLAITRRGVSNPEVVKINAVVRDYLVSPELVELNSIHDNVVVKADLLQAISNIMGNSVQIGKSLVNLVNNAAEAMPEGGTVHIKTFIQHLDSPKDSYEKIKPGEYAVLTVSDSGIGISQEDRERIFEPFYTKKIMGRSGTGLGMPLVWGIVKDHNGYLDIQSSPGEGTIISLYFPVTGQKIQDEKAILTRQNYMGNNESILVVDDVEEQRMIATSLLTKIGYLVSSVSSGEAAIAFLKDSNIDLVVLDMIMEPGMDGLDTYKGIIKDHPGQKIVIASGFAENDRVRELKSMGVAEYIQKPYTAEIVGMAVKRELDR